MTRHITPAGTAILLVVASTIAAPAQPPPCSPFSGAWCPAPAGDRCGRHRDAASCKADPACYGIPYRGESFVACVFDRRGFSFNCPAIGCTSTPPARR